VYVHCWAGRGRTGTVVGCYLKRHGIAEDTNVIQELALATRYPQRKETSPHKRTIRMVRTGKREYDADPDHPECSRFYARSLR